MKKFFAFVSLLCFVGLSAPMFTSCGEDDDNESFFAGESEDDYKSAEYTIWMTYEGKTEKIATETFPSRKLAEATFDEVVRQLKNEKGYSGTMKLQLKRGNAIMKSATLTW